VAKIGLDGASVVAVIGELEPAGMPQHMGMHEERESDCRVRIGVARSLWQSCLPQAFGDALKLGEKHNVFGPPVAVL
jgi:hypothetical protein